MCEEVKALTELGLNFYFSQSKPDQALFLRNARWLGAY